MMEHRKPNPSELTDVSRLLTDAADAAYDIRQDLPESLFRPFGRPSFNAPFADKLGSHWQRLERLGYFGVSPNGAMRGR